jgi:hypothetical protein
MCVEEEREVLRLAGQRKRRMRERGRERERERKGERRKRTTRRFRERKRGVGGQKRGRWWQGEGTAAKAATDAQMCLMHAAHTCPMEWSKRPSGDSSRKTSTLSPALCVHVLVTVCGRKYLHSGRTGVVVLGEWKEGMMRGALY